MIFEGTATALITPFTESGVDFESLGRLIDFQLNNGVSALVPCGTTGEPATMTAAEREAVIDFVINKANRRVPVIAGCGTNCTTSTIERSLSAARAGADAILLVTPYYNKCTQKGLVAHFSAVAEKVDKPIIVYNVPGRTAVNIQPETAAALSGIPNIRAVKEACGNLAQIEKTARLTRGKLDLYSGDDELNLEIFKLGGIGTISVASNVIPKELSEVYNLYRTHRLSEAEVLQNKLQALIKALFIEVNPIPVKAAARLLGLCAPYIRLPLTEIEPEHLTVLEAEMKKLGIIG
ncbi:MAG: 4-hydroxy-tetrahydrodipicolinate synthase [Clostridiales bacterium]|jgi:4-hydroxy-tetrahydrodipicolinate synthase|nr:4-hydroxy-tetrahydrodipicolinate synthase [Clostridiales bacterium]